MEDVRDECDGSDTEFISNQINQTFELLNDGETPIELRDRSEVVVLVGTTGTGKSTLAQFIAGKELRSIEVGDDTGEFTITDGDDRISTTNTIISKMLFPELITDDATNVAYYDCPGFSDTRSTANDIAVTYFIKKVMDSIESVKICFVVSYHSCRTGTDLRSFMTFVTHAVSFLKDIDKYRDAICLIVTKVDNSYVKRGKQQNLVPDVKIIEKIAQFLEEVIGALKMNMSDNDLTDKDRKLYTDGIKLVKIMLEQRENDYPKIAIFGRPDEPGLLSKIEMLFEDRERLTRLIHETLKFVKKDNNDFGYSISDKSQSDVFGLVDHINDKFTEFASRVANILKDNVQSRLPLYDNICKLKDDLVKKQNELEEIISTVTCKTTPQQFVDKVSSLKKTFNLELDEDIVTNANNQVHYFRFLQDISNKELMKRPVEWSNPLKKAEDYITELNVWYNFLISLYKELSKHESLRKRKQIARNLTIVKDKVDISVESFSDFLNKLTKEIGIYVSECSRIDVNEYQINELKYVIDKTILSTQFFEKNDKQLIVRGEYVIMSEISEDDLKDVTTVIIFANNTVFIDKDFKRPSMSLAIISPQWEIISERVIDLSGEDGRDISPSFASSRHYSERGTSGNNGLPGLPGGPSGNFFGIGTEFKNGDDLNIICNGGCGGCGQNGGKGAEGSRGEDVNVGKMTHKDVSSWAPSFVTECNRLGYTVHHYKSDKEGGFDLLWYKAYGAKGHQGGKGGDGGRGGLGGNAGTIRLFELRQKLNAKLTSIKGQSGMGGVGSEGGLGGIRGNGIDVKYKNNCWRQVLSFGLTAPASEGRGPNGYYGTSNLFSSGQQIPQVVKSIQIPTVINKYKCFARVQKPDIFKKITASQFLSEIELEPNIENEYDIHSYIEEFNALEMHLHKIQHVQLSVVYRSLIDRIVAFAKKCNNDMGKKKTLNYLYVAAYSKLCNMQNNLYANLVIDIESFLDSTVEKIQSLENLDKFVTIEKFRKEYENQLKEKINEANKFIENDISLEIKEIGLRIDNKIRILIDETIEMQKQVEIEKMKLIAAKKKLEDQLTLQGIVGGLKLVATLVGFLGTIRMAVGAGIGMGTMVAESLTTNQNSVQAGQLKLPHGVTKDMDQALGTFIMQRQKKIDFLNEQIDEILNNPDGIDEETSEKLNKIKIIFKNIGKNSLDQKQIEDKKNEVELALKMNFELKKQKNSSSLNKAKFLQDKFQKACQIADVSIDMYNSVKQSHNSIEQISEQIKLSEKKFNALKQYEAKIYDTMVPILDGMKDFVNDMAKGCESQSQVALHVTKWKVKSTINDIKLQMHQFTKGFQVEESLLRCIEQLNEAMTMLVSLYDQIQEYYQQQELADYLANICSPTSIAIKIEDKKLLNDIKNLELKIQSNILLAQFDKAKQAFSQSVFPFANVYLPKFELPLDMQVDNGMESLISNALKHVEEMRSKVKVHMKQYIIKGMDEYLTIKKFNSEGKSTKPFYIWENAKFKNAILDLLSGKKVKFYSDVRQYEHNENEAVKFKSIGIRLKCKDGTTDDKLKEHLLNFQVEMVHHGQSYYKVKNEIYVIHGDSQTIVYTFEKGADGTPATTNMVYEKIMSGYIVLSPYVLWSIQLVDLNKSGFDDLKKYADCVNLELFGEGTSVIGNPYLGLDLSKYYQRA